MTTKVKLIADGAITPDQITLTTASAGTNTTAPATTAFVQQEITALVDSSPAALNTLNELAAALGDDANFSTTVTNSIATKLPLAGGTLTGTLNITQASTADTIKLTRSTTAQNNMIKFASAGADKWIVGQRNDSTEHFRFYSYGTSNDVLSIQTDGNVGIGTSSPSTKLHVSDSSGTAYKALTVESSNVNSDAGISFIGGGGNDFRLQQPYGSAGLFFYDVTNTSERMRIDSVGAVGINTTSPDRRLHVVSAAVRQGKFEASGSGEAGIEIANSDGSGELAMGGVEHLFLSNNTQGKDLFFKTTPSGGSATERLRIASNGDVHLSGGNQMTNALAWYNSNGPYELASIENVSHTSYNDSGGLLFKTAGLSNSGMAERMRLNSSGQCLINFSSPASTSNFLLGVDGSIGLGGDDFIAAGAGYGPANSGAGAGTIQLYNTATGNMNFNQSYSHSRYYFYHGGNEVFRIEDGGFSGIYGYSFFYTTAQGSVGVGALNSGYHHTMRASGPSTFYWNNRCEASGGFHTYSDERFKENITTIPGALDKVALMNGVTFNWIDAENRGSGDTGKQFGVIAQNMLTVDPELPSLNPDPLATQEEIDNEELETDYYTMDYSRITPFLIEAIKELKTKLEAAEARITTLEG